MQDGIFTMSKKELSRLQIIEQVSIKKISQISASRLLDLSSRQVRRLQRLYEQHGASGLISKQRGQRSNHQLPDGLKDSSLSAITKHYSDFGPKLACECLLNREGIKLSVETTRQIIV